MAIEYSLNISTTQSAEDIARSLRAAALEMDLIPSSTTDADILNGTVTATETWIRVSEQRPNPFNPVVTDFDFSPTVVVWFRMGKETSISLQQDKMIRLVTALLALDESDAILHREYEDIWLLRKNGELTLSNSSDSWTPSRLTSVTTPYERVTHIFK